MRCGLHVSWWNSACVTSRKRFSIPMLRTNELSLVPYMRIKIAMVCQGKRVRTGGYLSSPTQMQARRARALLCCPPGSSRIYPVAQIPRTSVPIQRHRHLNERRWRPSTRKPSVPIEEISTLQKMHRPAGGTSVKDAIVEHKQAKNLWSLREEFMAESSKTSSAMTTRAKVDYDTLVINGQSLTTS